MTKIQEIPCDRTTVATTAWVRESLHVLNILFAGVKNKNTKKVTN